MHHMVARAAHVKKRRFVADRLDERLVWLTGLITLWSYSSASSSGFFPTSVIATATGSDDGWSASLSEVPPPIDLSSRVVAISVFGWPSESSCETAGDDTKARGDYSAGAGAVVVATKDAGSISCAHALSRTPCSGGGGSEGRNESLE